MITLRALARDRGLAYYENGGKIYKISPPFDNDEEVAADESTTMIALYGAAASDRKFPDRGDLIGFLRHDLTAARSERRTTFGSNGKLDIRHHRFMARVMANQQRSDYADDDIQAHCRRVSELYGQYRMWGFSEAAVEARAIWLEEYLAKPFLPRAEEGTVKDLRFMLGVVYFRGGLLVLDNGRVLRVKKPEMVGGGLVFHAFEGEIPQNYPYVDEYPQDRKPGEKIPEEHFEMMVQFVLGRPMSHVDTLDEGKVEVVLPEGRRKPILDAFDMGRFVYLEV